MKKIKKIEKQAWIARRPQIYRQYNRQRKKKNRQWSSKHYTESYKSHKTNSAKNQLWTRVLRKGKCSCSTSSNHLVTLITNRINDKYWNLTLTWHIKVDFVPGVIIMYLPYLYRHGSMQDVGIVYLPELYRLGSLTCDGILYFPDLYRLGSVPGVGILY